MRVACVRGRAVRPDESVAARGAGGPVALTDVVSPELGRSLDLDDVLANADVAEFRLRCETVGPYADVRIEGDDDDRHALLKSLMWGPGILQGFKG